MTTRRRTKRLLRLTGVLATALALAWPQLSSAQWWQDEGAYDTGGQWWQDDGGYDGDMYDRGFGDEDRGFGEPGYDDGGNGHVDERRSGDQYTELPEDYHGDGYIEDGTYYDEDLENYYEDDFDDDDGWFDWW